jgi:NCS1 family nucleobase:cation symporter-1
MESQPAFSPLTPVPPDRRPFRFGDCFALWSSLGVGLLVLQAGALLVPGLGFGAALAAILLGSAVGAALLALAGVVGSDTGVATMAALRPALGVRGSFLPTFANIVQLVGWGAFEIIIMRDSADAIARRLGAFSSPLLWTLVWGGLATLLAFGGPLRFVRQFLRRWGIWLVYAAALWLTVQLLARYDLAALVAQPGSGELAFGLGVDLVVAMPLSWLPLVADYTRFGRPARPVFWGTALGYCLANVWFYALGAAYALALGGGDLLGAILAASGGLLALGLILVDETDNAFADIYSAAVSTGNLLPQLATPWLTLGYGALCTLLALLAPIGQYQNFLLLIGSLFAPLFGIVLVDHFVVRQRRIDTAELERRGGAYWYLGGWNWPGLLAWAAGVGVFQLIAHAWPDLGATLPGLAVAGLTYLLLARAGLVRPLSAAERA